MKNLVDTNLLPLFFLKEGKYACTHFQNGILDLRSVKSKLFISNEQKQWDSRYLSNSNSIKGVPLFLEITEKFSIAQIPNATLLRFLLENQQYIPLILPQEQINEIKIQRPKICFWGTIFYDKEGVKIGDNRYTKEYGCYIRSLYYSSAAGIWKDDFHSLEKNFSTEYPALILDQPSFTIIKSLEGGFFIIKLNK